MQCLGRNLEEHCCWVDGKVCPYLKEDLEPGYRWTCSLRHELGSWDAVMLDSRYVTEILPLHRAPGMNCRDWPNPTAGGPCNQCGAGK